MCLNGVRLFALDMFEALYVETEYDLIECSEDFCYGIEYSGAKTGFMGHAYQKAIQALSGTIVLPWIPYRIDRDLLDKASVYASTSRYKASMFTRYYSPKRAKKDACVEVGKLDIIYGTLGSLIKIISLSPNTVEHEIFIIESIMNTVEVIDDNVLKEVKDYMDKHKLSERINHLRKIINSIDLNTIDKNTTWNKLSEVLADIYREEELIEIAVITPIIRHIGCLSDILSKNLYRAINKVFEASKKIALKIYYPVQMELSREDKEKLDKLKEKLRVKYNNIVFIAYTKEESSPIYLFEKIKIDEFRGLIIIAYDLHKDLYRKLLKETINKEDIIVAIVGPCITNKSRKKGVIDATEDVCIYL